MNGFPQLNSVLKVNDPLWVAFWIYLFLCSISIFLFGGLRQRGWLGGFVVFFRGLHFLFSFVCHRLCLFPSGSPLPSVHLECNIFYMFTPCFDESYHILIRIFVFAAWKKHISAHNSSIYNTDKTQLYLIIFNSSQMSALCRCFHSGGAGPHRH